MRGKKGGKHRQRQQDRHSLRSFLEGALGPTSRLSNLVCFFGASTIPTQDESKIK